MKAIKFKESELYSVQLMQIGLYLVDGNVINVNYSDKLQVKDINNIIPINRQSIVVYYTSNGEDILSVDDYNERIQFLLKDRIYNNFDEEYCFNSLEAEYEYKKFCAKYKPIYKNIEVKGEPLKLELVESVIETNNKFIKSDYINGGSEPLLFVYNRPQAVKTIVHDKFTELGMIFKEDINYEKTNREKIWGNSIHSCIRYAVAFNKYLFGKEWEISNYQRGTLSSMLSQYESDKRKLEEIIQVNYNIHFGKVDSSLFDFEKLLSLLKTTEKHINSIESYQKTKTDKRLALNRMNESIEFIQSHFK